jgi:membrane-associated phospholipid phosphatase
VSTVDGSVVSPCLLPRGRQDFLRQLAIWAGFALGYEIARALAEPSMAAARANAFRVVDLERRIGGLYELDAQRWVRDAGGTVLALVDWTYWLSQFVVVGAVLIWIYLRHTDAYLRLRNTLFAVNLVGLIGYVAVPTAPPRLLPGDGFVDTLSGSRLDFSSGVVHLLANPYAAMPSLHAADALVIAASVASVVRPAPARAAVLMWPLWVCFSLLATGNHFVLDIAAGAALGALGVIVGRVYGRRHLPAWVKTRGRAGNNPHSSPRRHRCDRQNAEPS